MSIVNFNFKHAATINPIILTVGKRSVGKTTIITHFAEECKISKWFVFCPSLAAEEFWTARLGSNDTVYGLDDICNKLETILTHQRTIPIWDHMPKNIPDIGIIFDGDVIISMLTNTTNGRNTLQDLMTTNRYVGITLLMECQHIGKYNVKNQYESLFPTRILEYIDYFFVMDSHQADIKLLQSKLSKLFTTNKKFIMQNTHDALIFSKSSPNKFTIYKVPKTFDLHKTIIVRKQL